MTITKSAVYTGIGTVLGGIGGLFANCPLDGAKIGGALGMQVASHDQHSGMKDELFAKAKEGIDGAGRKISDMSDTVNQAMNKIGDKTAGVVEKVGEAAAKAILEVAHKYSALLLVSYAFSIVNGESNASEAFYLANCQSAIQNVVCFSRCIKNFTLTGVSASIALAVAVQVWQSFLLKKNQGAAV